MFVYQGKLKWYHYAKNETFVIILPSGPVRVGDSVYLFSQWTEDSQGRKKQNWFQTITVDSVTQTDSSDVTFVLKGSWYSFTVTTKGGYKDLSLIMRNPLGGVSDAMTLQRIWESKHELTGTTRVWTGKFKWMDFSNNEPAIFVVPDGFGEGKPILSLWQWSKASNGKTNEPSFRNEIQKNVTGLGSDTVKFSYHSYYDIDCTWDAKTDQLDVTVKENGYTEDVGDMIRSAIIERKKHIHDVNPVEPTPEEGQCELRKPQAQSALPRIVDPLPFPKGLLETLAHSAAYVDQAGYLAKYALDQFATLDADYHVEIEKVKAKDAAITNLKKTVVDLTGDRNVANASVKELKKQLEQANMDAQGLRDDIAKLNENMREHANLDDQARKILKDTQDKLEAVMQEKSELQNKLDIANSANTKLNARIAEYQQDGIDKDTEISRLRAEVHAQKELNKTLAAENISLNSSVNDLKTIQSSLTGKLKRANDEIDDLVNASKEDREEITKTNLNLKEALAEKSAAVERRDKVIEELRKLKQETYKKENAVK